jgi:hypothetical protein
VKNDNDYIARDDESEAKRLEELGVSNTGGPIFTILDDEDIKSYALDGLNLREDLL